MDVHRPERANGYGIVFISGSGFRRPLSYDAPQLKEGTQIEVYGPPLTEAGYTVFSVNHRAIPRFLYPAAIEDVQRAVRFIRHQAAQYGIDSDRIGAVGGSSGGYLVSMLGLLEGVGDPKDPDPINRERANVQCVVGQGRGVRPSQERIGQPIRRDVAQRRERGFT